MKNFKWDKKYLYWGVTAFCVVVASIAFFWVLNSWEGIRRFFGVVVDALKPVIYGFLIAYLLNRILTFFEDRAFSPLCGKLFGKRRTLARKTARVLSITVTVLLALGLIAGVLVIVLPELYNSVMKIVANSSDYFNVAMNWVEDVFAGRELEPVAAKWLTTISDGVVNWLQNNVLDKLSAVLTSVTGGLISVVTTLFDLFVGMVISVYLLYNRETFCAQARKLTYSVLGTKAANTLMTELRYINDAFGSYIVGTLIDALIVGVLNYLFMVVMRMPYSGLVTVIVAVTNLIPFFGPFIGAVPSALLIWLEDPTKALVFLIFTVVLQQVDGQILKPRIHASRTGLSGFWVMFAILLFGGLFGIVGMIVGVPVITVLYNIVRRLNNRRLRSKGLPEDTRLYRDLVYVDPATKQMRYRGGSPAGEQEQAEKEETQPEKAETPEREESREEKK